MIYKLLPLSERNVKVSLFLFKIFSVLSKNLLILFCFCGKLCLSL